MRQVTRWVNDKNSIEFAAKQLEAYDTKVIYQNREKQGVETGEVAIFREDMSEE